MGLAVWGEMDSGVGTALLELVPRMDIFLATFDDIPDPRSSGRQRASRPLRTAGRGLRSRALRGDQAGLLSDARSCFGKVAPDHPAARQEEAGHGRKDNGPANIAMPHAAAPSISREGTHQRDRFQSNCSGQDGATHFFSTFSCS